jgi:hypothetical protein
VDLVKLPPSTHYLLLAPFLHGGCALAFALARVVARRPVPAPVPAFLATTSLQGFLFCLAFFEDLTPEPRAIAIQVLLMTLVLAVAHGVAVALFFPRMQAFLSAGMLGWFPELAGGALFGFGMMMRARLQPDLIWLVGGCVAYLGFWGFGLLWPVLYQQDRVKISRLL